MQKLRKHVLQFLPHYLVMLFMVVMPWLIFEQEDIRAKFWLNRYYYMLLFYGLAFYLNFLILVPQLFFKGKKIQYFTLSILSIFILVVISHWVFEYFLMSDLKGDILLERFKNSKLSNAGRPSWRNPQLFTNIMVFVLIFGFSTGTKVMQELRKKEILQKELEKTQVDTELAFLKNQINPHFFFNTLNNIYALIVIDTERAQKAVEKLAGLMRYLIYESDVSKVKFQKELNFTRNYIDLMKQRLSSKVRFNLEIQENAPDIDIPPLIFISFIENAFKHGISYREPSFIDISLKTEENEILFTCKNSVPKKEGAKKEDLGGVGYSNAKKRLDILYDRQYQLEHRIEDGTYEIKLRIPLL